MRDGRSIQPPFTQSDAWDWWRMRHRRQLFVEILHRWLKGTNLASTDLKDRQPRMIDSLLDHANCLVERRTIKKFQKIEKIDVRGRP